MQISQPDVRPMQTIEKLDIIKCLNALKCVPFNAGCYKCHIAVPHNPGSYHDINDLDDYMIYMKYPS
jgi:hypothetical protein